MDSWRTFHRLFGWAGVIRALFYPITVLLTTPVRLVQTLWASRVLASGQWEHYNCFTARKGLSYLFYWTQALNLTRYGRWGRSPCVGLGDYPLSRWFFYTLPSLFAFWRLAPIVPLVGLFGWWQAHVIWIERVDGWWLLSVMGLALISTSFYGNAFVRGNYNALGWMFFPIGLYALSTGQWLIALFAWLAASFTSFTVVVMAGVLSLVVAVEVGSPWPIVAMVPAVLKLLAGFAAAVADGTWKDAAVRIMKAIGMANGRAKYTRKKTIGIREVFYLCTYMQFLLVCYFLTGAFSPLCAAAIIVFLINASVARFADCESIEMLMMSVCTMLTITSGEPWLLPSYWLVMSPLSLLTELPARRPVLDTVPRYAPFHLKMLLDGMERFLDPVGRGQRVLMALDDPQGSYEKVFDGYRVLLELPIYVATKRQVLFLPNWFTVFELNYEGAPGVWGRDPASVRNNMDQWNADFAVIYQEAGTELAAQWQEKGFAPVGKFSWADYTEELRGEKVYSGPTPDWWLLRKPPALENVR